MVVKIIYLVDPSFASLIFHDVALKGVPLYVCLSEFDREYLKNNANKDLR